MSLKTSQIKIVSSSLRVIALYLAADIDYNRDSEVMNITNKYMEQDVENLCTLKNVKFKDISSEGIVSYSGDFPVGIDAENVTVFVRI